MPTLRDTEQYTTTKINNSIINFRTNNSVNYEYNLINIFILYISIILVRVITFTHKNTYVVKCTTNL